MASAKNGDLKPEDITFKSRRKVGWQFDYRHEWEAVIIDLTNRMSGRAYDIGKLTSKLREITDKQ